MLKKFQVTNHVYHKILKIYSPLLINVIFIINYIVEITHIHKNEYICNKVYRL